MNKQDEINLILSKIDNGIDTDKDLDRLCELRRDDNNLINNRLINSGDRRRTEKSNIFLK